ncbi:hypothetical protein RHGRI_032403 [Rhododendron griersonianum]|uniref:Beta-glucosidase n=1 Tax=Rhododendron griersonianum TaxID=479676 RepID=A0AAV6IBL7_9ERIC|nr:hypothetical protein RHGRI_032403 [Rhododendron griersonianum]
MEAQGNGYANGKRLPIIGNGFPLIHRASFTDDFVFGAASAAFQLGPCSYLAITIFLDVHGEIAGRITDGSNGNTAIDFYCQFKEDVKIMKKMGLEAFRFSISWSRILPSGQLNLGINKEGIQFYNDLIDELIANGYVSQINHDLNGF